MYKFSSNVSEKEYEIFIKNFYNTPITQDYRWASVKNNWDNIVCGLYNKDKLIAAALILTKTTTFGIKIFYSPRGFLIDYKDKEILSKFTDEIKKYAKKEKAFLVKIDPMFSINEYSATKSEKNVPFNFSVDYEMKKENLLDNSYIHKGLKKEMNAYIQPRFNMMVPLVDSQNKFLSKEILLKKLKKKNKNQIGDYHLSRGVFYEISSDEKDIDEFYRLLSYTEKRQNINLRDRNYFNRILSTYKGRAKMFFAKLDLDKYLEFIKKQHRVESDYFKEKKQLIDEIRNDEGNIITVCTALVILPVNEEGIRVMEYLYAGSNPDQFKSLNIPLGLVYRILEFGLENKCHYCNLGGVDGNLDDSLTTFKSKFNPMVVEFVGEFDLVINKFYYALFDKILPKIKKIKR